jgi:hypothetical protein
LSFLSTGYDNQQALTKISTAPIMASIKLSLTAISSILVLGLIAELLVVVVLSAQRIMLVGEAA